LTSLFTDIFAVAQMLLRNYLETFDLTDSGAVQDAREGGQDGPNEAEGEGAADDLAVPR
jgi:hypothetical protein